ncbi:MAG: shikimate dehydrogenase [Sandaracinaceae bacterium]
MTTGRTRLYGVLGWPVAHSRSPRIHTAALAALGEDAAYLPLPVRPGSLEAALAGLLAVGADGLNVTLPHKEAALALVDEATPGAHAVGAVNTLSREGGRWVGSNTDGPGLLRALRREGGDPARRRVLVRGAGGAARAAVAALGRAGVASLAVAARRPPEAERLADGLGLAVDVPVDAFGFDALRAAADGVALLVPATSATLGGGPEAEAFARSIPLEALSPRAAVVDLVYAPRRTALLRRAEARGIRAVDGLGMLVEQAALALEGWLGRPAPVAVMRVAAEEAGSS